MFFITGNKVNAVIIRIVFNCISGKVGDGEMFAMWKFANFAYPGNLRTFSTAYFVMCGKAQFYLAPFMAICEQFQTNIHLYSNYRQICIKVVPDLSGHLTVNFF